MHSIFGETDPESDRHLHRIICPSWSSKKGDDEDDLIVLIVAF